VLKVLEQTRGTPQFVEIVRDFNLKDQDEALLEIAAQSPASSCWRGSDTVGSESSEC